MKQMIFSSTYNAVCNLSYLIKLLCSACCSMDWWVPYHVNMMPNDNNETISLKDIPTVPYLIHDPSLVINNSSQEEVLLAASSGDGVRG